MTLAITRRETIAAMGLAMGATVSPSILRGPRGVFLHDAALDPLGRIAAAMTGEGWALAPIDGRADALLHRLAADKDAPAALAGLTSSATRFVFAQVAQRRGMRRIDIACPLWALAR